MRYFILLLKLSFEKHETNSMKFYQVFFFYIKHWHFIVLSLSELQDLIA